MINLPSEEQFVERFRMAPRSILDLFQSDQMVIVLQKLEKEFALNRASVVLISQLVGLVGLVFVRRTDLPDLIEKNVGLDKNTAQKIYTELNKNFFEGVPEDLDEFYSSVNEKGANTQIQEEIIIRPNVQREEPLTPATPFMLHEHEDVENVSGGSGYVDGLARPSFYIEAGGNKSIEGSPQTPTARLEFGGDTTSTVQIESARTKIGKESARIIHYSAPQIPTDPFTKASQPQSRTEEVSARPQQDKPAVHSSNVINLKDLPK